MWALGRGTFERKAQCYVRGSWTYKRKSKCYERGTLTFERGGGSYERGAQSFERDAEVMSAEHSLLSATRKLWARSTVF
ncbi:hypothetical protein OXB_3075 [Bacillus sp. OxB-1]|nr:hypothetical protein OXB_3075 [Bacillus sp. OxB-1]